MGLIDKFVLKQIFGSFLLRGIGILISMLQVPILMDCLNNEKYGIWITLFNIINWISIFDFGLTHGLRNKVSELYVKEDHVLIRKYLLNTIIVLCIIFGLMSLLILSVLANLDLIKMFNSMSMSNSQLFHLICSCIVAVVIKFIVQIPVIYDTAKGNINVNLALLTIGNLIGFIIIYLCFIYKVQFDLLGLSLIVMWIPNFIFIFYNLYFYKFKFSFLRPRLSDVDFNILKPIVNLSVYFFIAQITSLISFASIPFIITQYCGPVETTNYNVTYSLFNFPILLMSILCGPLTPLVSQKYFQNNILWIKNQIKLYLIYAILIIGGIWCMYFFADVIYGWWLEKRLLINWDLVFFISLITSINIIIQPFSNILNGIGDLKGLSILGPLSVLCFFTLIYINRFTINGASDIIYYLLICSTFGLLYVPFKVYRLVFK